MFFLNRVIKGERGQAIVEFLLVLPLLLFVFFAVIQYWGVLITYQQAESLKYHVLSRMEVKGGLYPDDRDYLINKLEGLGADPVTVKVDGTLKDYGDSPVTWPGEVELWFEFVPKHFNNFTARILLGGRPGEPVKIGVKGVAVSQVR